MLSDADYCFQYYHQLRNANNIIIHIQLSFSNAATTPVSVYTKIMFSSATNFTFCDNKAQLDMETFLVLLQLCFGAFAGVAMRVTVPKLPEKVMPHLNAYIRWRITAGLRLKLNRLTRSSLG